jgi:hypothetical protein
MENVLLRHSLHKTSRGKSMTFAQSQIVKSILVTIAVVAMLERSGLLSTGSTNSG